MTTPTSRFSSPKIFGFRILPNFFPKILQTIVDKNNEKPLIYDTKGVLIPLCSDLKLHKISGSLCSWCRKSKEEIYEKLLKMTFQYFMGLKFPLISILIVQRLQR